MRCRNCGTEIDEFEIFCDECKKELKKASSREELRELTRLIEEQKRFEDLDKTIQLDSLKDLVVDEKIDNIENLEDTKVINNDELTKEFSALNNKPKEEEVETNTEIADAPRHGKKEEQVEPIKPENKKNNEKKLIIIISIVITIIILITTILLLNNNKKPEKKEEVIDYKKVINDYGTSAQKAVQNYIKEKNEVPTWQQIGDLIEYKKYEVTCEIHNIYNDGNIYLNSCKVNDKTTKHSFGKEQEEVKEGKKIEVYKKDNKDYYTFSNIKGVGTNLVGTITCKTDNCTYIEAYNKYVIIEEESKYYLYNYETDTMEFGPFDMEDEYSFKNHILSYDNIVYGVLYNEDNQTNLYNVSNSKTLKNIKGELVTEEMNFIPSIMYKYNYVILSNRGKNDFVNLKTGNVSYSIKENINTFYEDTKNNIVYITASTNDYSKFKVYNSNGKLLFDGKEFSTIKLSNNNLIVGNDKNYYVYDNKLNLKVSSKTYDEILGIYDDFIVVIDNKHLEILDMNDKVLATFEDEWDSSKYTFNSNKSGKYTDNGKNGIYLIVEDKTIPFGTSGHTLKYYYILSTKEIGVTKLTGIN